MKNTNNSELTPEQERQKLESLIFLAEIFGETNKTPEQIGRESETQVLSWPLAPNLNGVRPPKDQSGEVDVAIPQSVKDALDEAIKADKFPLDPAFVLWMEAKVAEFNNVTPEEICADGLIYQKGKMWEYYPEVENHYTGFTYYSPEESK
jgi:hypothetical protein